MERIGGVASCVSRYLPPLSAFPSEVWSLLGGTRGGLD